MKRALPWLAAVLSGWVLSSAGSAGAADAAAETLVVRAVEFEGNKEVAADDLQKIAAPFVGRALSAGEIEELRHRVSRHYIDLGFINSGAVYPEDHLRDGVLRLRIIEGRITELRVAGNEGLGRAYFSERLTAEGEALNMNILQERFQMLMADPLLTRLNARVLPGENLGEAVLDVQVNRARPWQATVFTNNHRSPSTGETAIGVTTVVRNLTGRGDVFDATLQSTRGGGKGGFGWSIPFGLRLPQLAIRFENGDSSVIEEPLNSANVTSTVTARELTLTQPIFAELRRQFSLALGYSARDNATKILGESFSFVPGESSGTSHIRSWRFAQEYLARNDTQVLALRSTFVRGRTNTLEEPADSPVAFPARRYRLWLGQSQFSWKLNDDGWRLFARLDVQSAGDRLVALEKFAVGGNGTVRGYRENTLVRDNGFAGSVEIHFPVAFSASHKLDLYPFVDLGSAWNRGETRETLRSLGVGAGWQLGELRADVVWGYRLVERPDPVGMVVQDHGVHFQLSYTIN